jgi:hypothetical protein
MPTTPDQPDNLTDLAAFRAQVAAAMAAEGLDHDDIVSSVLGNSPAWDRPGTKPLPLHPTTSAPTWFRVRAELRGATPPIWRALEVPAQTTLDVLHDVLQVAFGFTNSHLHRFALAQDPHRQEFEGILTPYDVAEGDPGVPESRLRLDQLLANPGDTLLYTYDFGDDWDHLLTLEAVVPGTGDPADGAPPMRCVAGGRRGVIDDVGGVSGWERILDLASNRRYELFSEEWHLLRALGLIDVVDEVDIDAINRGLLRLTGAASALDWLSSQPFSPTGASSLAALVGAQHREAQLSLAGYLAVAQLSLPIKVSQVEAEAATAVLRAFLAQVGAGLTLTSAGFLPPATVVALMAVLDPDNAWVVRVHRENAVYPLLHLREATTKLGLTRKSKGYLLLTAKGQKLMDRPEVLFEHVAERLPVERGEAGAEIALLLLMLVAAGEARDWTAVTASLDQLSSMIGWDLGGGGRIGNDNAVQAAGDTRRLLEWAASGMLVPSLMDTERLDGPGARLLARAALTSWP